MGQVLHGSGSTTEAVGRAIPQSARDSVGGRYRHQMTNRSLKMTANYVFTSDQSRGERFHSGATMSRARYSSLIAASSRGKCPRVRTARRSSGFNVSMTWWCR